MVWGARAVVLQAWRGLVLVLPHIGAAADAVRTCMRLQGGQQSVRSVSASTFALLAMPCVLCLPGLQAYTSYLQPITSHKLWNDVRVSPSF